MVTCAIDNETNGKVHPMTTKTLPRILQHPELLSASLDRLTAIVERTMRRAGVRPRTRKPSRRQLAKTA